MPTRSGTRRRPVTASVARISARGARRVGTVPGRREDSNEPSILPWCWLRSTTPSSFVWASGASRRAGRCGLSFPISFAGCSTGCRRAAERVERDYSNGWPKRSRWAIFGEGLAALLAAAAGLLGGVAEGEDSRGVVVSPGGPRKVGGVLEAVAEADPVQSDAHRPRPPASLSGWRGCRRRRRTWRWLRRDRNREPGLGDIRPGAGEGSEGVRRASKSSTTMKCQGWRFIALPVRRPASTILRMMASGTGRSR